MDSTVEIIIRPYEPLLDDPYIYSTWTKYGWYSPKERIKIPKKQWFTEKIAQIKQMLTQDTIRVACFKDDPTMIAGYIVARGDHIEQLCIKKDYHHQGIDQLLTQAIQEAHHDRRR